MSPKNETGLKLLSLLEENFNKGLSNVAYKMLDVTRNALGNAHSPALLESDRFFEIEKKLKNWKENEAFYKNEFAILVDELPTAEQHVNFLEQSFNTGFKDFASKALSDTQSALYDYNGDDKADLYNRFNKMVEQIKEWRKSQ